MKVVRMDFQRSVFYALIPNPGRNNNKPFTESGNNKLAKVENGRYCYKFWFGVS